MTGFNIWLRKPLFASLKPMEMERPKHLQDLLPRSSEPAQLILAGKWGLHCDRCLAGHCSYGLQHHCTELLLSSCQSDGPPKVYDSFRKQISKCPLRAAQLDHFVWGRQNLAVCVCMKQRRQLLQWEPFEYWIRQWSCKQHYRQKFQCTECTGRALQATKGRLRCHEDKPKLWSMLRQSPSQVLTDVAMCQGVCSSKNSTSSAVCKVWQPLSFGDLLQKKQRTKWHSASSRRTHRVLESEGWPSASVGSSPRESSLQHNHKVKTGKEEPIHLSCPNP